VAHRIKKAAPGQSADAVLRIVAGHPDQSALLQRMASRYEPLQMPPLGTELVDTEAVTVMRRWISELMEELGVTTRLQLGAALVRSDIFAPEPASLT